MGIPRAAGRRPCPCTGQATRVLVLTKFEDDESVFAAMRAGAPGYLVMGAQQDEIVRAIRSVADGQAIFGPSVARKIIDYFAGAGRVVAAAEPFPELTAREREVLDLIISAIFAKLQVAGRAEAIIRARRAGLGNEP